MATKQQAGDLRKPGPEAPAEERAVRARAYLDLWERHLVHAAVRVRLGPVVPAEAAVGDDAGVGNPPAGDPPA